MFDRRYTRNRWSTIAVASFAIVAASFGPWTSTQAKQKREKPPQVGTDVKWVADEASASSQTKGKVTIEVTPLDGSNFYDFPQIFAFTDEEINTAAGQGDKKVFDLNVMAYYPQDKAKLRWLPMLSDPNGTRRLAAFWVKVKNDTDHIINFGKDAKVYLQVSDAPEPVQPVRDLKMEIYTKLLAWEVVFEENRKKGFLLDLKYPVGLAAGMFDYRFGRWQELGFQNKDTLPGLGSSGLLIFDVKLEEKANNDMTLLFYEVPTDTSPSGEITARSRFNFKYHRQPIKEWFNRETMHWVVGDPPQPEE